MNYRVECETLDGELIFAESPTLGAAKHCARRMSTKNMVAYAVAVENNEAVGHVVYGDGLQLRVEGRLK